MDWKIRFVAVFAANIIAVIMLLSVYEWLEPVSMKTIFEEYELLNSIVVYSLFSLMSVSVARDASRTDKSVGNPFRDNLNPHHTSYYKSQMGEVFALHWIFLIPIFIIIPNPYGAGSYENKGALMAVIAMVLSSAAVNIFHLKLLSNAKREY